ncbi:MAG: carboxypeptidase-like regulatory domain-containing protein [Odoribacter sp.]|nr:carboxypeptidase-like regulatory domain-containing protein [Odoribacter sp.]
MKKMIFAMAAALMAAAPIQAKDLQDLRIYINPGHGGWGSGDRHMGTIGHGDADYTDTCGFFETNTNTWKGLALLQRLADYGFKYDPTLNQRPEGAAEELYRWGAARDMSQGLVMSHVKNGVSRDINEIAVEVEVNNFDYFISVHSNAATEGSSTNYPAMFIRGEGGKESVPGSTEVSRVIWPYAYSNEHSNWSHYSMTNPSINYDIDFWSGDYAITTMPDGTKVKGYYAVLRHNTPGMLVEGYFHTYQPARHRAMNPDVCAIEGEAYARGIAEYFGVAQEETGDLYGIVRDLHERFKHKYYNAPSSSPDAFMPLNGAKVTLVDASGNDVAEYTTDDEWNGAFVFRHIAPGDYTIRVSCEGYKDATADQCGPFTVEAAKVTYPRVYLESLSYEPPTETFADYVDEINTPAILAADAYNFGEQPLTATIPALEGKTIKRVIYRNDKLYILAHDTAKTPTLLVVDANTLSLKAEVSTEGTVGSHCNLSDIAVTADGILIGSAAQHTVLLDDELEPGEVKANCNFYRWENGEDGTPQGAPIKWFDTGATANFYSAVTGFTFAYTGTIKEGTVYLPSYSTYYNRKVWLNTLDIFDGELSSSSFVNVTKDRMNMDELGDDVTISLSPASSQSFIVNSKLVSPMQFHGVTYEEQGQLPADHLSATAAREGYFKYAGHAMMVAHDNGAIRLIDITKGVSDPSPVETSNTAVEGSAATTGRAVVTRNQDDAITAAHIELFAINGSNISRYSTKDTEQPMVRGNWAYDLTANPGYDNDYTLFFHLTDAAHAKVRLVALQSSSDQPVIEVADADFAKGINSVVVDASSFSGAYTWEVIVDNKTIPSATTIFNSDIVSSGVAIDLDTNSSNYGTIFVSQKDGERGIRAFSPSFEPYNTTPWLAGMWDTGVGASPWRLAMLGDKLIITDWGDAQGGMYLLDPGKPTERTNFFAGTCNSASGEWTYNGKVIGGSTSGVAVRGSGEGTTLISFQEDWPSDYSLNLVTYDLGNATQITEAPVQSDKFKAVSSYLANGNVDVLTCDQGMVLGQVRGGGNNSKGVPSFLVTTLEGDILFNSGESMESLNGSAGCFALSPDGSTLCVQDDGNNIHVCSLEWTPEFKLTELYTFNVLMDGGWDLNSYQATFDPAGNLYVANRSSFRVFALPREASQATTMAPTSQGLIGTGDGINDIAIDEPATDESAIYYNLQGVQVSAGHLTPGIYVKVTQGKATKILVK